MMRALLALAILTGGAAHVHSHAATVAIPTEHTCSILMSESMAAFNADSAHVQMQEVMCEWLTQTGHAYGPDQDEGK